jgi:hypothetical protein
MILKSKVLKTTLGMAVGGLFFIGTLYLLFRAFDAYKESTTKKSVGTIKTLEIYTPGSDPLFSGRDRNLYFKISFRHEGQLIYDIDYYFDEYYRRKVHHQNPMKVRGHLIFDGCSFTFGDGLEVKDTLAQIMEHKIESINAYNHAFPGGSPHLTWNYLQNVNLNQAIPESEGTYLYIFILDHLSRWFGRPKYFTFVAESKPFYALRDGNIISLGLNSDQFYFKKYQEFKEKGLGHTFLHTFETRAESDWNDEELSQFALVISKIKQKYLKRFPRGRFVFVIHPIGDPSLEVHERLLKAMGKKKVEAVNAMKDFERYHNEINMMAKDFIIPHDGHPTAELNHWFVDWLIKNVLKN